MIEKLYENNLDKVILDIREVLNVCPKSHFVVKKTPKNAVN